MKLGRKRDPADESRLPIRPGYGTQGLPVTLRTNYFHLTTELAKNPILYRYNVEYVPENPSRAHKRQFLTAFMRTDLFNGESVATDYAGIVITTKKLKLDARDRGVFKVERKEPDGDPLPPQTAGENEGLAEARRRRTIQLKVQYVTAYTLQNLMDYLQSPSAGGFYADKGGAIQALNIVLARAPNLTPSIGHTANNVHYPVGGHLLAKTFPLGQGLQAHRGYFASVRMATGRVLLNLNVTHGAFYKPGALLDLMNDFLGNDRGPRNMGKLEKFLRGVRFTTKYTRDVDPNGKAKLDENKNPIRLRKSNTIKGFARKPFAGSSQQVSFEWTDASGIKKTSTIEQYFRQMHDITLQKPQAPVMRCGNDANPVYIPPELCTVMAGQQSRKILTPNQTAEMIRFAVRAPNLNATSITTDGLRLMQVVGPQDQVNALEPFGIRVNANMLTVPGRILAAPQLQYIQDIKPMNGSWNLARQKFRSPAKVSNWTFLAIFDRSGPPTLPPGNPVSLMNIVREMLVSYGMNVEQPLPPIKLSLNSLAEQDRPDVERALEEELKAAEQKGVRNLLVVLPSKDAFLYAKVKLFCDVRFGIGSVCVTGANLLKEKGQAMLIANLALKFNIKNGGANHFVKGDMSPADKSTMLMGIDVTHPSPGSAPGAPSIAGIVASVDVNFTQFPASIKIQESRKEMVTDLGDMVVERLRAFQKRNNNALPNKIILYRDGVSEGQYHTVLDHEFAAMSEAFDKVYGAKHPKVSVIVVGKRHHTRFYPTDVKDSDARDGRGAHNPKNGTCVDRHITGYGDRSWDFYLQPHTGLQGTARPAHYVIIKDDIGFGPDQIQQFTHKLCYNFGRATKAVSICPPAYYADLLCERGRAYLHSTMNASVAATSDAGFDPNVADWTGGVHARLADTMFYL